MTLAGVGQPSFWSSLFLALAFFARTKHSQIVVCSSEVLVSQIKSHSGLPGTCEKEMSGVQASARASSVVFREKAKPLWTSPSRMVLFFVLRFAADFFKTFSSLGWPLIVLTLALRHGWQIFADCNEYSTQQKMELRVPDSSP